MNKNLGPSAKVRANVFGAATAARCRRTPLCHCEARSNVARLIKSSLTPLLSVLCRHRHIPEINGAHAVFL